MKLIAFHVDAETEMIDAAAYYEAQQRDLGRRFLVSVQDAINRIAINPDSYPIVELDLRRCLTRTFPYGILFRISPEQIQILAVMHLHRDPNYWKER